MHGIARALGAIAVFLATTAAMCVVNFVAQIMMILLDVLTRLESSSAAMLALWFVTGVFTTIFSVGDLTRPAGRARFRGLVVLAVSLVAIVVSLVAASLGHTGGDPLECSLLFTNVQVVIAFYVGTAAMAGVLRHATAPGASPSPPSPR